MVQEVVVRWFDPSTDFQTQLADYMLKYAGRVEKDIIAVDYHLPMDLDGYLAGQWAAYHPTQEERAGFRHRMEMREERRMRRRLGV